MKTLKKLCLIPLILLGSCIAFFALGCIFEFLSLPSQIFVFFTFPGILLLFIGWLPAFCLSLAALISASQKKMKNYVEFAIVDIVISVLWFLFSMLLFMGGMSV